MKLFISYAHKDATELAKRLAGDLEAVGHEVWIDLEGLSAGKSWAEGIEDAIKGCDATVALLSHASYVSEICRAEQTLSIDLKKPVYPLLVQADAPRPLTLYIRQYLDFSNTTQYGDRLSALKEALTKPAADDADFRVAPPSKPRSVINTAPQLPPNFVPRPDVLERLRNAILSDETDRQIALTVMSGMGGSGKSVLAAALSRDPVVQAAFPDGIVWVNIGREPGSLVEQIKLIGTTLQDLGGDYSSEEAAVARLRALLPEKAALIVLDDVWDVKHVEPYRVDAPRCRTLVTSRSSAIGNTVNATGVSLETMKLEEARDLLKEWSGSNPLPPEADEVAKECGNLPLALAMAGAMIRNGTSWSNVLKKLQNAKLDRISEKLPGYEHPDLLRALQVSVDDLDSVRGLRDLRARYFDLAIFREEAAVPLATLAKYWEPVGLDEDDTEDVVTALKNRSLIRVDEQKQITLHDLQFDYIRASVSDIKSLHDRLLKGYNPTGQAWHIAADGYLFPSLVYHLLGAGRESELPMLFANDEWMIGRFNHDGYTYTGFIEDLMTAWDVADAEARTQIAPEQEPTTLADCVRYALIRTSINSLANNYTPELVARAVETRLWTLERAMGVAANIGDPATKIQLCTLLLEAAALVGSDQTHVARLGLKAVVAIEDESRRVSALGQLAQQLTGDQKALALELGLKTAVAIGDEFWRERALRELAGQLSGVLLEQGLEAALAIEDESRRVWVLRDLGGQLSGDLLERGLDAVLAIEDEYRRTLALEGLVGQLNGMLLERGLEAALKLEDEFSRAWALGLLAPQLSGERKALALERGLEAALAINIEPGRAAALWVLAGQLSGEQKTQALRQELDAALAIEDEFGKAWALRQLAEHLSGDQKAQAVERALEAALAIGNEHRRVRAVGELAAQLSGNLLEKALEAVLAIEDESRMVDALRQLAAHLSGALLEQGLDAALAIEDESSRAWALAGLAERLNGEQKSVALEQGLEAALGINKGFMREMTLRDLARQLSGTLLKRELETALAIEDVSSRVSVLGRLAEQLSGEQKARALEQGLAAALGLENEVSGAWALGGLAGQLSGTLLEKALEAALAAVLVIEDESTRASVLRRMGGQLSGVRLERGLEVALAIKDESSRADALWGLAGQLSGELLERGLNAALEIKDEISRAWVFMGLAEQLNGEQKARALEQALEASLAIKDNMSRANALITLVPQLSEEKKALSLGSALKATLTITNEVSRAEALSELVPQLSEEAKGTALAAVLEAVLLLEGEYWRAKGLGSLGGQLSGALLERALNAALELTDETSKTEALAGLARQLSGTSLEQVFTQSQQFKHPDNQLILVRSLLGMLDDTRVIPVARAALLDVLRERYGEKRESIFRLLINEAPVAPPVIPVPVVGRIADDIIDVCWNWRWQ